MKLTRFGNNMKNFHLLIKKILNNQKKKNDLCLIKVKNGKQFKLQYYLTKKEKIEEMIEKIDKSLYIDENLYLFSTTLANEFTNNFSMNYVIKGKENRFLKFEKMDKDVVKLYFDNLIVLREIELLSEYNVENTNIQVFTFPVSLFNNKKKQIAEKAKEHLLKFYDGLYAIRKQNALEIIYGLRKSFWKRLFKRPKRTYSLRTLCLCEHKPFCQHDYRILVIHSPRTTEKYVYLTKENKENGAADISLSLENSETFQRNVILGLDNQETDNIIYLFELLIKSIVPEKKLLQNNQQLKFLIRDSEWLFSDKIFFIKILDLLFYEI